MHSARKMVNVMDADGLSAIAGRTCEEIRQNVFDYIEMFYNSKRSTSEMGCCRPLSSNGSRKCNPGTSTKLWAIQTAFVGRLRRVDQCVAGELPGMKLEALRLRKMECHGAVSDSLFSNELCGRLHVASPAFGDVSPF